MPPRFVITPYDPVLWLPENLDKYGIPGSDLIVTLLDFAVGDGWHLHHVGTRDFSMLADGKLSVSGSVLEHHILVFEIASGLKVPQFVQWYRAHIPERYELYLFVDDSRTSQKYISDISLKLTPDTSLEHIAHFTGYPVERVENPVESTQKPVYAWHFSTGKLRFQYADMPVEAGLILKTDEEPVPERSGFHASIFPLDALRFFAVRPNDRIIVSRVRLSGKIIEDKRRGKLVAQQREHLWTADAETTLENFALSYIQRAVAWLGIEGVIVPVFITDTLQARQRWFAKEISQRELYTAADGLAAWVYEQKNPPDRIGFPRESDEYYRWAMNPSPQHFTAAYWINRWKVLIEKLPLTMAELLASSIRHDTQFFAFESPHGAILCHAVICNYLGWQRAENSSRVREHIEQYIMRLPTTRYRGPYHVEPPEEYLHACKLQKPEPDTDLHVRLMRLAPDGYSEG